MVCYFLLMERKVIDRESWVVDDHKFKEWRESAKKRKSSVIHE